VTARFTPEARARQLAARAANRYNTRPTTRPGSEATTLQPGDRVVIRIARKRDPGGYNGRTGYVATLNHQEFPDGRTYVEIGVTWYPYSDWVKASAEAWFRNDELESL
jgi:hypothetical protein